MANTFRKVYKKSYTPGGNPTYELVRTVGVNDVELDLMKGCTHINDGELGLVPKPVAGKENAYLRGDGEWAEPNIPTYTTMTGCASNKDGVRGLVPQPMQGQQNLFLAGDGNFKKPSLGTKEENGGTKIVLSVGNEQISSIDMPKDYITREVLYEAEELSNAGSFSFSYLCEAGKSKTLKKSIIGFDELEVQVLQFGGWESSDDNLDLTLNNYQNLNTMSIERFPILGRSKLTAKISNSYINEYNDNNLLKRTMGIRNIDLDFYDTSVTCTKADFFYIDIGAGDSNPTMIVTYKHNKLDENGDGSKDYISAGFIYKIYGIKYNK